MGPTERRLQQVEILKLELVKTGLWPDNSLAYRFCVLRMKGELYLLRKSGDKKMKFRLTHSRL